MAYLDFSDAFAGSVTAVPSVGSLPVPVAQPSGFSAIEWMVIGLAERDGLASLTTPGRVARALGGLFGLGVRSRLADDRLELLRRFAVLVRHSGWRVPASEIEAFLARYSAEQMEAVIASASRRDALSAQRIPA